MHYGWKTWTVSWTTTNFSLYPMGSAFVSRITASSYLRSLRTSCIFQSELLDIKVNNQWKPRQSGFKLLRVADSSFQIEIHLLCLEKRGPYDEHWVHVVVSVCQVFDLQYASPATVSRCGMVFVDTKNLGYKPYIWKWCNSRESRWCLPCINSSDLPISIPIRHEAFVIYLLEMICPHSDRFEGLQKFKEDG